MSLTGALLSGVSGLQAQSNAMGIISDNIANLNTVGYKKSNGTFSTLVVNSAATTTYSPGGVQSGRFALIATQGTLQASNSPLDVAVTGNGFFPVNDQGNGLGNNLYTRAGSFHQDVQGRLVNSAGMFLQGWSLNQQGLITNPNQIGIVSVGTTNGVAVDTQHVTVGANLDSTQTQFTSITHNTTNTTVATQAQDLGAAPTVPVLTAADNVTFNLLGTTYTMTYTAGAPTNTIPTGGNTGTFHSLADLASVIDSIPGMQANVTQIATAPAHSQLNFSSTFAVTVTPTANVAALGGMTNVAASYNFGDIQAGNATAQFNDPIQVFDALGTAHNLNLSVIHTDATQNQWTYELYAADTEISGVTPGRGLISSGLVSFNGDGSLNSLTTFPTPNLPSGLPNQPLYGGVPLAPIALAPATAVPPGLRGIPWANGAKASTITFNLGTAGVPGTGKTNGLTQFASQGTAGGGFTKNFVNQDGAAVGLQTGVTIDKDGFVIASFSNGATQKLFQVPVTTFADPSALQAQNGNTYSQTVASGNFNWRIAGQGGAGTIAPSSLEESNADLGDEFAHLITTQTAYSANSKTITTSNQLLQQLLQIIQ
ncbi:MAG TPA: flagellar hook-basal body complex protein [Alphaproteobacteria bacterium]